MGLLETLRNIEFEPTPMSMGLLQMGAQMLANSSNQPTPVSFGSVLGHGLNGFTQGAGSVMQQRDQNDLRKAQIEHYKALKENALKGADPYYQVMETSKGLYRFDARTGKYEPLMEGDNRLMRSTSDPEQQGKITGAKNLNTINKQTLSDGSEVPMFNRDALGGSGMNTIPPVNRDEPMADISGLSPEALVEIRKWPENHPDRMRIERALAAQPASQPQQNRPVVGFPAMVKESIQTQGAIDRKQAEATIENQQKIDQANAKKQNGAANMLSLLQGQTSGKPIEALIEEATGSGAGVARDAAMGFIGMSNDSANAAEQLKTLQGWLVSNVPRMEGPQSDFDVKNYQQMAAAIGDPLLPPERKKAALNGLIGILKKYAGDQPAETQKPFQKGEIKFMGFE